MVDAPSQISCREIQHRDIDAIVQLLHRGFPERSRQHWLRTMRRLADHSTPAGYPRFGYMLECGGRPVGVLLLIFSSTPANGEAHIRANVASWYVDPAFRTHATILTSRALSHKNVTFLNLTAAPHTWPILEAQGFTACEVGQFKAMPLFSSGARGTLVAEVAADTTPGDDLASADLTLLRQHASYGCISLLCSAEGRRYPFVFARRMHEWKPMRLSLSLSLPHALLIYCRDLAEFVRFAGPLSRYLALRGMPMVFVESSGPIPGLYGRFSEMSPRFYRGPCPPRNGDIAYTERVMFGI
jgi:hypothetical protein